ncbi:unnamed protein product [Zymoseptoria tritici ST99CH_3D1]|uniref:Cell wall protein PhiA n=1 Tax=Zymoseptoria tritici (strain ST99CH_3D7) TaxID=1276538 RepID=A0A1X7S3H3_ZYMT9|nr:unnamed protein product [Zymoseptoria tritici ST99CH_3D7]SMR61625.1 unnamed protein product [Zymoseptoria tritici ST99CH_3D1]
MQYSAITLMTLVSSVLAVPTTQSNVPGFNEKFGIKAHGKGINGINVVATGDRIFIGGPQFAQCVNNKRPNSATFARYSDDTISLWHTENPTQQLWVSPSSSGSGEGVVGYTTGNGATPHHDLRSPFKIDKNGRLTFNGVGAKACPGTGNRYLLYFTNRQLEKGCVDVTLQTFKTPASVSCLYV